MVQSFDVVLSGSTDKLLFMPVYIYNFIEPLLRYTLYIFFKEGGEEEGAIALHHIAGAIQLLQLDAVSGRSKSHHGGN